MTSFLVLTALVVTITALVVTTSCCLANVNKVVQKPNIIFILADDYGFHDIGYHGSEIQTPTLDKVRDI